METTLKQLDAILKDAEVSTPAVAAGQWTQGWMGFFISGFASFFRTYWIHLLRIQLAQAVFMLC